MELPAIIKLARKNGWTVSTTTKGHLVFWTPDQDPDTDRPAVTTGGTPSDWRAAKNLEAQLRAVGLPIPHKGKTPPKNKRK